jgi:hypothetical protein
VDGLCRSPGRWQKKKNQQTGELSCCHRKIRIPIIEDAGIISGRLGRRMGRTVSRSRWSRARREQGPSGPWILRVNRGPSGPGLRLQSRVFLRMERCVEPACAIQADRVLEKPAAKATLIVFLVPGASRPLLPPPC